MAPQDHLGKRPPSFLSTIVIAILIWLVPPERPKTAETVLFGKHEGLGVAPLQSPAPFNETVSGWLCEDAIRRHVSHPSTINFHSITDYARPDAMSDGVRVIWQTFTAKNDDGLELSYRARCEVSPDGHLDGIVINEK